MSQSTKKNDSSPTLFFSMVLLLLLVIPYLLTLFVSEPYPAVILPGGHGRYEKGEKIVNHEFGCFVFLENQKQEIRFEQLLGVSMSKSYIGAIVQNHLGLRDKSREQIQELRQWYSKNIGSSIESMELVTYEVIRNVKDGKLLTRRIIKNERYNLTE